LSLFSFLGLLVGNLLLLIKFVSSLNKAELFSVLVNKFVDIDEKESLLFFIFDGNGKTLSLKIRFIFG
jgi:hypothetical protein